MTGTANAASRHRPPVQPPGAQRGIALLLVLWLSVLLTVLATGLASDTRGEMIAARNSITQVQARLAADGAVSRALYEMARPAVAPDRWQADGEVRQWTEGGVALRVSVTDESARIDLNFASEPLLRGLLSTIGGLDADAVDAVYAAIQDWRDADDLARPNGAEEQQYRAAGRRYRPTNQPFESVDELLRVLGVTPELYSRVEGFLTVQSRLPGINPAVASREVLLALPNSTPALVDVFMAQRAEALRTRTPVPAFQPAAAFNAAFVQVWRIRAEASMADGIRFVREAIVRASVDPRREATVFLWKEGS